jgi:histidine kinase
METVDNKISTLTMNIDIPGYTIEDTLFCSTNSIVYRAVRHQDDHTVIIKASSKEYPTFRDITRAKLEYDLLRRLEDPRVISVHGFERHGNLPLIFMEDFATADLSIFQERGMPFPLFFDIAVQIVEALGAIHHKQIVHKDINPRNILINLNTKKIKVIDFNTAAELTRAKGASFANLSRAMEGSVEYLSPEQTGRMNRTVDYRSDYYSLGVTFFELLTGKLPFYADSILGYVHSHITQRPPSPSDLNPEIPIPLSQIVLKLLNKNPQDRYQSEEGLIRDLRYVEQSFLSGRDIPDFKAAKSDVSPIFRLSDRLYGRDKALEQLEHIFQEAVNGKHHLVLVLGNAGVGKTALINELKQSIFSGNGYFAGCRFSEFGHRKPFGGISEAFNELALQLLSEPDERVAHWRAIIADAIGVNSHIILDIVPEFAPFIKVPSIQPQLDFEGAQYRMMLVFHNLLRALCSEARPLVLFFDDFQWCDDISLALINHWVESELSHLMIVCAARNCPPSGDRLCPTVKKAFEKESLPDEHLHQLHLLPISEEAIVSLVADTFALSVDDCAALGSAIFSKTNGHPHFATELLQLLYQKEVIRFSRSSGRWVWDLAAVESEPVSDNLVTLLLRRLDDLPPDTRSALITASLIGNQFSLHTLVGADNRSVFETAELLIPAIDHGILLPLNQAYRISDLEYTDQDPENDVEYIFTHNRIHQAVYSTASRIDLPKLHRNIGEHLLKKISSEHREEEIFEAVNHLNLAATETLPLEERKVLAELNYSAGKRAEASFMFSAATYYYRSGLEAIASVPPVGRSDLALNLSKGLAHSLYLSGDSEEASALCDAILEDNLDISEVAAVYLLKSNILNEKPMASIQTICKGLAALDFDFPLAPDDIETKIEAKSAELKQKLEASTIEALANLPELSDPRKRLIMELLDNMVPPAVLANPRIFILVELTMLALALNDGVVPVSAKSFMDSAVVYLGNAYDLELTRKLSTVSFRLLERYNSPKWTTPVLFVYSTFISPWLEHNSKASAILERCYVSAMIEGDIFHAFFSLAFREYLRLYTGVPLGETVKTCDETLDTIRKMETGGPLHLVKIPKAALRLLTNEADWNAQRDNQSISTPMLQEAENYHNTANLSTFSQTMSVVSFIHDDYADMSRWIALNEKHHHEGRPLICQPDYELCRALSLIQEWERFTPEVQADHLKTLREIEHNLSRWSESCPDNFAHKHYLFLAEAGRLNRAPLEEILNLYKKAEDAIRPGDFIHWKAIINELQGRLLDKLGYQTASDAYLLKAYRLFEQWGAKTKLLIMKRRYPGRIFRKETHHRMSTHESSDVESVSIDFASLMKASIAISTELRLDRVLSNLTTTILENAGAEKVVLILKYTSGDKLLVEAVGRTGRPIKLFCNESIDASKELCPRVVRYVARSEKPLVYGNAYKESLFRNSDYFEKHRIKSLLCLPIIYQNTIKAIVYLENNLLEHAFSSNHVSVLQAIAAPAAIALENAFMYQHLDDLVQKKTSELEATQAKLVENAHKAGMSEIASSVLHNVGNTLNSVRTSGQIILETTNRSTIDKLTKANTLLKANIRNLEGLFEDSDKGIKLAQYYLKIGKHLEFEKETLIKNTRQLISGIDAITDIIAAQQSYAYANTSISETIPLQEIIDSALVLAATSFSRHKIEIKKEYDSPIPLPIQKTKMLHTVINLVKNAKEAMQSNRDNDRKLTIRIQNRTGDVLLCISDNGCGIDEKNKSKLFTFGFTTKKNGHGSGLHSSALYINEMGGAIWAKSDGAGKGTDMYISMPLPTTRINQSQICR